MHLDVALVRSAQERGLPRDLIVRDPRPSHRPRERLALRIARPEDVDRVRRFKLPIFVVREDQLEMLGYPMRLAPLVVAARVLEPALRSDLRVVTFVSEEAARRPRLEDLLVAILKVDPIAARALLERNRDLLDLAYLTKRVYQEDLEPAATAVRFQDVLDLPPAGEVPAAAAIERLARANWPKGVLP